MLFLRLVYIIAMRRIVSSWRLELVLLLGTVLAVALMSSSVVFSDLLADVALRRALTDATPEQVNISARTFNKLEDSAFVSRRDSVYQAGHDFVQERVERRFNPYLKDRGFVLETSTFFFQGYPQLELDHELRPRGRIKFLTGLLEGPQQSIETSGPGQGRIDVVRGRWPYSAMDGEPATDGEALEVAIDARGAQLIQLDVGDAVEVFPASGPTHHSPSAVKIVGVFHVVDPEDVFWYGRGGAFSSPQNPYSTVHLITTEDAILERVGHAYPGLSFDATWLFFLDPLGVSSKDVGALQDTIKSVERDVPANLQNSTTAIKLDDVLRDYEEQLLLARVPLLLMVFLVVSILIYYLVLIASLIVRTRATEISTLKSRGSTSLQIGVLALMEGLLLVGPALALGLVLALGVSRALGNLFFDLGTSEELPPISLSAWAFFLGLVGALLAVAVFTISTIVSARQGIVELRQTGARPARVSFIHRYYLDFLFLALILLLWWQIKSRESVLVRSVGSEGLEIDFSLLLGPVLGLLAVGLLVMRFFPIALAILARLTEPVTPPWLLQGLRHVSRDPIVPGALVVLLMMATALGIVGSSFSSTLEHSQQDRALYAAGSDLRIEHGGDQDIVPIIGLSERMGKIEGLVAAAEVERSAGSPLIGVFNTRETSILAVDTSNFGKVVWDRRDFAGGRSLKELTETLATESSSLSDLEAGISLPLDTTALALWVNPSVSSPISLNARLQDSRGFYFDTLIGQTDFNGWGHMEAEISPLGISRSFRDTSPPPEVKAPFTLIAIYLRDLSRRGSSASGALLLGELAAVRPTGEEVLSDFQTVDGWQVIEDYSKPGLFTLESSRAAPRAGTSTSARFSWVAGVTGLKGIHAGGREEPMPALVSTSFLDVTERRLGETVNAFISSTALPVRIVGVADYFPTLGDPWKNAFAVVDLRTFNRYVNLHSQNLSGGSHELWLRLEDGYLAPGEFPDELVDWVNGQGRSVGEVHVASDMVSQRVNRPLVNAGWGGLLVIMFLSLVLASASGVMLFSYINARERQIEFALLRTLGFSGWQINGVIWFDLLLVVGCGIVLGTLVGQWLGIILLPVLELAEEGARVIPPMVLHTNSATLLASYAVLGCVALGTLVWLWWLNSKLELQKVLRIGEI